MAAAKKLPSVDFLDECFLYEESTGKLFWRERPVYHFKIEANQKQFNTKHVGKECFRRNERGYRGGTVSGHTVYAHRVIWKIVTREDPPPIIDHKDRNTSNNRWENLREATFAQNMINTNTTVGVHFDKSRGKWMAFTKVDQRFINLGRFETYSEAVRVRSAKIKELYGEFAPQ